MGLLLETSIHHRWDPQQRHFSAGEEVFVSLVGARLEWSADWWYHDLGVYTWAPAHGACCGNSDCWLLNKAWGHQQCGTPQLLWFQQPCVKVAWRGGLFPRGWWHWVLLAEVLTGLLVAPKWSGQEELIPLWPLAGDWQTALVPRVIAHIPWKRRGNSYMCDPISGQLYGTTYCPSPPKKRKKKNHYFDPIANTMHWSYFFALTNRIAFWKRYFDY